MITNLLLTTQDSNTKMKLMSSSNYILIKYLVQGLKLNDVNIIMEILLTFEQILELDALYNLQGQHSISYKIEEERGLDILEDLQKHPNITVYNQIEKLIDKFFADDNT